MTDLQQDAPSAPAAGWYPDPVRPGATRYWSGAGWTDQVSAPAVEPALVPAGAPGYLFDIAPAVEAPAAGFAAPPTPPTERHASQSEWHQTRARPVQRPSAPPLSTSMRTASDAGRQSDPYDRNWIAGIAIALAVLSVPGLAARVLWDLPALTQSIFAGAPIGISLLALARAARRGSGMVLSIVAVVVSAATLIAAWVVDPALIQAAVDTITGLIPA